MVLKRNKHVLLGRARSGGAWRAKAAWVRAASVGEAEAGEQTAAHLV